jgi:protein TBF1
MQTQFQEYTYPPPPESSQRQPNNHPSFGDIPEIPYHTQSAPTQVLYERARQAAITKVSPASRRAGLPSQRRPWSTEEENALMAGLDRVKGPHWSQILAMFGPGGTINETLKDRNQVQLKDKARNLKLFFLKSGIEVPYYLQFVTGELKTRAPAQAAKNEAREREQSAYDDDKAHIEGVMGVLGLANASQLMEEGGVANGDGLSGENGMNEEYPSAGDQAAQYAMTAQPVDQQPRRPQITGGVVTT